MSDAFAIPGFVDLQVNGFKGVSFSDVSLTHEDIVNVTSLLRDAGTSAYLLTIITSSQDVYEHVLPMIAAAKDECAGAIIGVHLEGPFISPEPGAVGAHVPSLVRNPNREWLEQMIALSAGNVRMLTLAPERPGALELIAFAKEQGISVSVGHSMASRADLASAAEAGAVSLTHLGNGMPNNVGRHDNALMNGLDEDRLLAMIITDGHHLPPTVIKTIVRAKGAERIAVVSDSCPPAGMPPGTYQMLGNHCVLEESGKLHNPDKHCLVGSSATMLECMNHLASLGILSVEELVAVGFSRPLQLLGLAAQDVPDGPGITYDSASNSFKTLL